MSRLLSLTFARFVRGLVVLATFALLVLLGLDLLFATETVPSFLPSVEWVSLSNLDEVSLLSLGAFCLFLPLFYIGLSRLNWRLQRGIVGRGSNGKHICLESEAVSRAIAREVRQNVEEVVTVKSCETWQAFGSPRVELLVVISDRAPVPQVQAKVKAVAKDVLTRLIGFADGDNVRVKVREIAGAPAPNGKPRRSKRPAKANSTEEIVSIP